MNKTKNWGKRLLLVPLALVVTSHLELANAGPVVTGTSQPWPAPAVASANAAAKQLSNRGQWDQHFQGQGNVTNTRCQNMTRGANCITAVARKNAARRAAAARAAAQQNAAPNATVINSGGNAK